MSSSTLFKNKTNILILSAFAILACIFFLKGYAYIDTDFGWHIRMGEYIQTHGIPRTDPLSYTMPDYPIVDLEWITNILFAYIYTHFSIAVLSVLLTIACFAAVFLQASKKYLIWFFLPAFLASVILFGSFEVRTQVISWLFFSLLIKSLYKDSLWQKVRYIIPVLMLLWANMHGSFLLGNIVLGLYGCSLILSKKATKIDLFLIILSIGMTLINPYGFRLWHEVWIQSTDESLHWIDGEWVPIIFNLSVAECMYFALFFMLIFRYYKKITPFKLFLSLLLFAAGCSSVRHVPLFVIASLPLITQSLSYLNTDVKKYPYGEMRLKKAYYGFFLLVIILTLLLTFKDLIVFTSQPEDELYPIYAVNYLQTHVPRGNMLSVFEWGGYLDLHLPQKKVFIDGRMDNWRLSNPGPHESAYIYGENRLLSNGELSLASEVKKYNITTILYYSPSQTTGRSLPYHYNTMIDLYLGHKTYSKYPPLATQLTQNGFKIMYQDNLSAVYEK